MYKLLPSQLTDGVRAGVVRLRLLWLAKTAIIYTFEMNSMYEACLRCARVQVCVSARARNYAKHLHLQCRHCYMQLNFPVVAEEGE